MKLRKWQSESIDLACNHYHAGNKHFLALATPAAGKTIMASVLAKILYGDDLIDLVLCFSPSSIVAKDFSDALGEQFNAEFDGQIGSLGNSFTYQRLNTLDEKIWRLFEKYRVFVIFDEIHHCAASSTKDANTWGDVIIKKIKGKAAYSIALTGTPWRSDAAPIAMSEYCDATNKIRCDYIYGLKQAIKDKVCRIPQVIAVDNDQITVVDGDKISHFTSFMGLLSQSIIPYSRIVESEQVIIQLLSRANNKLEQLRLINPNAGGLIVASSILHAWQIQQILFQQLGEYATVVTSNEEDPSNIIKQFRYGNDKWIVSVGMISEGTNIPRLQICCHLTIIKTELHFRQILGRILRMTSEKNQEAILFMPAQPKLVEFAYRVGEDIPEGASIVKFEQMDEIFESELTEETEIPFELASSNSNDESDSQILELDGMTSSSHEVSTEDNKLATSYEKTMGILGRFKHEYLQLDLLDNF
jgi:superfamily II DNA or RNA helicase